MVRKTKSGSVDKRSNSSAGNAAKARQKLSSYIAKGKKMREEASDDEDDFGIRDSDFDSEPEPETEVLPEVEVSEKTEVLPEVEVLPEKVEVFLEPEKNTFKSVRVLEPVIQEPEPEPIKPEPVQSFEQFQKQKYVNMSQMLRKSILRY